MNKPISVYDAFLECLHILADVAASERYKVVDALHRMAVSPEGSRVFTSGQLVGCQPGCCYEGCDADGDVHIGAQAFCRHHATDGLLSDMEMTERAMLVSLYMSSDDLLVVEEVPS